MSKSRKFAMSLLTLAFAISVIAGFVSAKTVKAEEAVDPKAKFDFYLDVSAMDDANLSDTLDCGSNNGFIIQASKSAPMTIDGNVKNAADMPIGDNKTYQFNKRLKFNGKSDYNSMDRTISFYLEKQAKVSVYALSSSSGDSTREITLYKNTNDANNLVKSEKVLATANALSAIEFNTTAAGSYYFGCNNSGINIYFIGIEYTGEAEPVVRNSWADVAAPVAVSAELNAEDPTNATVLVKVDGVIGDNGADKIFVNMRNEAGNIVSTRTVLKYASTRNVSFTPAASGKYTFDAEAVRLGEEQIKLSVGDTASIDFILPFGTPTVRARTAEGNSLFVTVGKVLEADKYVLYHKLEKAEAFNEVVLQDNEQGTEITYSLAGYSVNDSVIMYVKATRSATSEERESQKVTVKLRPEVERDWQFAAFGQSTKTDYNYVVAGSNIFDGVSLVSCTHDPKTNLTGSKGGKFTYGGMDGISYYYTKINAKEEDFRLRARVIVDYINPTPDGQEGFALLVRDSIGTHGDNAYYYTNSVAAIATKLQYTVGATRYTIKDGLGARFVTGVKDTHTAPATTDLTQKMYPFMKETVYTTNNRKTDGYIVEIEKKNNVYYTRYFVYDYKTNTVPEKPESEYVLYHDGSIGDGKDGNDQLCVIDKDNIYVGFAVARGCDATFADIEFEVKERDTTPIEIVPEVIEAEYKITSPTSTGTPNYNFRYSANADGKLDVSLNGTVIVTGQDVKAFNDFEYPVMLQPGENVFETTFVTTPGYEPDRYQIMSTYDPYPYDQKVFYLNFGEDNGAIYAAPDDEFYDGPMGKPTNDGTIESPLDLQSALNYVRPGQTVFMLEGTYTFGANLTIERGNNGIAPTDGAEAVYKYLRSYPENKTRPVIDFQNKGTGIKMWGDYWHLEGFDITATKKGNKGIQLGGHNNILENIVSHDNGDSGFSVSGKSTDPKKKWPSDNLILNCTAYMNKDSAEEDADGFASKLYCGEGNVFRGCIAYCNADDGWDLYAKTETGSIGAVTIENCITFGNGFNVTKPADKPIETRGNGNGFKLGGESLPGKHKLTNSISFGNKLKGIDSNSCPDDIVDSCLSFYNTKNYAFYSSSLPAFKISNCLSLLGTEADQLVPQKTDPMINETNYFISIDPINGIISQNSNGEKIDQSTLVNWKSPRETLGFVIGDKMIQQGDFAYIAEKLTVRKANGSIDTQGLFDLKEGTVGGARIEDTPGTDWTSENERLLGAKKSGCKKGCKSSIGATSSVIAVILLGAAVLFLVKKQSKKNA